MAKKKDIKIGVLAVQGDVLEHIEMMNEVLDTNKYTTKTIRVKTTKQLEDLDGLIIPGGEGTVMSRLIAEARFGKKLIDKIHEKAKSGMAVFGTCAGTIMLSKTSSDKVVKDFTQTILELMDIEVIRNTYGRQPESFERDLLVEKFGKKPFRGVFIRAPVILSVKNKVQILAQDTQGIYAAQQDKFLAVTFHPELTDDTRFHQLFLDIINS